MKNFIHILLIAVFMLCGAQLINVQKADASVPPSVAVRLLYSTANLTGATHVRLIDTAARAIQGVFFSHDAAAPIYLAVGASSQPYDSEADVMLIPASGTAFVPVPISGGMRISVKSAAQTLTSGQLNASFLYY